MRTIRNSPGTGLKAGAEPAGIFQFLPDNCKKTCKNPLQSFTSEPSSGLALCSRAGFKFDPAHKTVNSSKICN